MLPSVHNSLDFLVKLSRTNCDYIKHIVNMCKHIDKSCKIQVAYSKTCLDVGLPRLLIYVRAFLYNLVENAHDTQTAPHEARKTTRSKNRFVLLCNTARNC